MKGAEVKSDKNEEKGSRARAVIFDLDDTLIRSTIDFAKIKKKTIDFYSSLGVSSDSISLEMKTYEITEKAMSMLKEKGFTDLECSAIIQDVSRLWDQVEVENVHKTSATEGAREALQKLKERSYKIGVVTRSCRKYALEALETAGLLEFVDVVVARDDSAKSKPDPEPLVQGMVLLGSRGEETVMVGDSITDLQCSKSAGVKFIGIWSEKNYMKDLKKDEHVTAIQSLKDLVELLA